MGLHLLCFNIYNILVNVTIAKLQDLNLYHIISIKIRTSLWQQTMTTKYHTFLQLFSVSAYTVRINKRVVYSQSCLYSLSPYYIKKPFQPNCKLGNIITTINSLLHIRNFYKQSIPTHQSLVKNITSQIFNFCAIRILKTAQLWLSIYNLSVFSEYPRKWFYIKKYK